MGFLLLDSEEMCVSSYHNKLTDENLLTSLVGVVVML
jgi:hypothetical protein